MTRWAGTLGSILVVALTACAAATAPTPVIQPSATTSVLTPTVVIATATAIPPSTTPVNLPPTLTVVPTPVAPTLTAAPVTLAPTDTIGPSVATVVPTNSAVPPTVTVAVAAPTPLPPTATAPAPLGPSQIAATAIASAAGEECVASAPQPAKGFIGNPTRGKMLFTDRGCSACHGDVAQGLIGPKLAGTTLSFSAVIQQLRSPRGTMQRYLPADQSDADECDVYIYVKSLK